MRSSRFSLLELARVVAVSGVLAVAATAISPATAEACPGQENGAACACGQACPMMQGSCGQAGGCTGAADKQPATACACPVGQGGSCACGADCPSKSGGTCPHGAVEKKPAGCGCGGAGANAAPAGGAAAQRAYLDPETGELTSPPAAGTAEAEQAATGAVETAPAAEARQVAVPGGGVIAPFPAGRVSHAVANVDETGAVHTGCEHGAE